MFMLYWLARCCSITVVLLLQRVVPVAYVLMSACVDFRLHNVFIIGKGAKAWVSLPRGKGIRLTIAEERDRRLQQKN